MQNATANFPIESDQNDTSQCVRDLPDEGGREERGESIRTQPLQRSDDVETHQHEAVQNRVHEWLNISYRLNNVCSIKSNSI